MLISKESTILYLSIRYIIFTSLFYERKRNTPYIASFLLSLSTMLGGL